MSAPDFITIDCDALPTGTRVIGFNAVERLSRPYEVEIFLGVAEAEVDLAGAIGASACMSLDARAGVPHLFSGRFAAIEQLAEWGSGSVLRALLVPRLWLLSFSRHSRVFTQMSVPDVIKAIFAANGLTDYELRLGSYEKEEHICQYRESDLAFISRWMEREGIYYFFEHTPEGEKLILQDSGAWLADPLGTPVRYHPDRGGDHSKGMCFRSFTCRYADLPSLIKLRDYDYAKPSLDVSGSADVSRTGSGEVSLYGERFFTPSTGARLAKIRAEELLARQVVCRASGTRTHLRPGQTFELVDHPRTSFNGTYATTELRSWGNQSRMHPSLHGSVHLPHHEIYFCELDAIPEKTQYRPEAVTPWPRVFSFETAVVDGPIESDYTQLDDVGRYLVRFNFDENAGAGGEASTRIRMMQPHGGAPEGFHFPLRKGTEVLVSFLGGDPDRPVISGFVPNAVTPSPVTSANHTQNVIQTGARNRLQFDDRAGAEQILLSTPYSNTRMNAGYPVEGHEFGVHTDDNVTVEAGHHMLVEVGTLCANQPPATTGNGYYKVVVEDNYESTVNSGNYELRVLESNFITHVVKGEWATRVKGDSSFRVESGNWTQNVDAGTWTTTVKGDTSLTVQSGNTRVDTLSGTMDVVAKKDILIQSTEGDVTIKSQSDSNWITVGNEYSSILGMSTSIVVGQATSVNIGNTTSLSLSLSETVFVGLRSELDLAGSTSVSLGAEANVFVGGQINMNMSMAIDCALGVSMTMSATMATEIYFAQMSLGVVNISAAAIEIGTEELMLAMGELMAFL